MRPMPPHQHRCRRQRAKVVVREKASVPLTMGSSIIGVVLILLVTSYQRSFFARAETSTAGSDIGRICPAECDCQELTTDYRHTITIDCYQGGLNKTHFSKILEKLPPNVNILEIRAPPAFPNVFEWDDNLNRFQQLERLSLINCGIPSISQSARLRSLVHLDLHGNKLNHIYMTTFAGLGNVEYLDLSHNRLTALPSGAFNLLKKLKSINLAHNNIAELAPNLLLGPRGLHSLQLDGNRVTAKEINELFTDAKQLHRLEINNCGLGDAGIAELKLARVEHLRRLGIAGNNLTTVPSAMLRNLPMLTTVDLSYNNIRYLAPCAFCSCNITEVILGHNLLGIDENAIDIEAFAETRISSIDLSFNYFDQFDSSVLGHTQQHIRTLDLSGNNLGGFHHRLTYSLMSLTHLHMAANGIKDIPASLPYEYTRLLFLNVSKNRIEYLPDDIASLLPSLRVLDVSHNFITTLSSTVMSTFVNSLDMIYLHHNPLDCRCVTQTLQQYMLQRHAYATELRYSDTVCATPELVANRPVHRVQHVNDCAILFGASYGLTQASELMLLLVVLLFAGILIAIFILALMNCGKHHKYKGTYVTREGMNSSRARLTHPMIDTSSPYGNPTCGTSTVTSALSEPLSPASSNDLPPDHLPPPPPPGTMFIAF
uniref:LRRCT domain-containing protein n=1 Tax=Panagrellus redivivus TaxID=6233 RepID=A0A7E4UR92_PANRE